MTKKETNQTKKTEESQWKDNYWRGLCSRQSLHSETEVGAQNQSVDHECQIGIYGWRKKFLYILIILIAALVVLNAALTLWIISVLNFSMVLNLLWLFNELLKT